MQPSMLLKLLRKLTVDVSNLSEYTTVALRVCIFDIKYLISYLNMIKCMIIKLFINMAASELCPKTEKRY